MKNTAFALLGAVLALLGGVLVLGLTSAAAPQRGMAPGGIRKGGTLFGLSVLEGGVPLLEGLTPATAVRIEDVEGKWVLIEYPAQSRGPVWVNSDNIVGYRTQH